MEESKEIAVGLAGEITYFTAATVGASYGGAMVEMVLASAV